jgi:GNAT superfamily N-acetyltransferase
MNWRHWLRPAQSPTARIQHTRSPKPHGHHLIFILDEHERGLGHVDYQICHGCRVGCINEIAVLEHLRREGLGRWMLEEALECGPTYHWVTTRQSRHGRLFFAAATDETGVAFQTGGTCCPHIKDGRKVR